MRPHLLSSLLSYLDSIDKVLFYLYCGSCNIERGVKFMRFIRELPFLLRPTQQNNLSLQILAAVT